MPGNGHWGGGGEGGGGGSKEGSRVNLHEQLDGISNCQFRFLGVSYVSISGASTQMGCNTWDRPHLSPPSTAAGARSKAAPAAAAAAAKRIRTTKSPLSPPPPPSPSPYNSPITPSPAATTAAADPCAAASTDSNTGPGGSCNQGRSCDRRWREGVAIFELWLDAESRNGWERTCEQRGCIWGVEMMGVSVKRVRMEWGLRLAGA